MDERNQNVEYFEGFWDGEDIRFKRVYAGHRFTDDECNRLIAGETIDVDGLVSAKTGKIYGVRGKLSRQSYEGHEYVGFERIGFLDKQDVIPSTFLGHTFSSDELEKLYAGEKVHVKGLKSSKGNKFDTDLTWGIRENGRMGLIFHFDEK